MTVRFIEQRMIFGMQADHLQRDLFQPDERFAAPVFFPGVEKKAPRFVAGRVKHAGNG